MKASQMRLLGFICFLAGVGILVWFARKTVTIQVDGKPHRLTTYSWTVAGALKAAHIPIRDGDEINPAPDQVLTNGEQINLRHAAPIIILADGEYHLLNSAKLTPGELLAEAGISLNPGDQVFLDGLADSKLNTNRIRHKAQPANPTSPSHRVASRFQNHHPFQRRGHAWPGAQPGRD